MFLKKFDNLNIKCKPKLIKVDVEGFDYEVLKGMKKTINNHQPIILVEFNKSNFYKIKKFLTRYNAWVYFYKTNVELKNVNFLGSSAEDALNIVHSNYKLENVLITNCNSDAFDSDLEFSLSIIICPRFISSTADSPHWFNESEDSIFEAKVA